jgi:hypothetical protein
MHDEEDKAMAAPEFKSFEAFWPYYLREHSKAATRKWHFLGSTLGLLIAIVAIVTGTLYLIPLGLLPGYGCAWYSHFFIERNRPASFTYPFWSFRADWKMWGCMISGRIDREVGRHVPSA